MPESAGAASAANDAQVIVDAERDANVKESLRLRALPDPARIAARLNADVVQCQRVLDELVAGQSDMKAKAVQVAKVYDSKAREVEKMITAARKAVKDAEKAQKDGGD